MRRISLSAALAVALTLALGVGTAAAGSGVKNGNFKQGTFSKWKTQTSGDQVWRLYNGAFIPPLNYDPGDFFDFLPEARSKYSPVIDQFSNPGTSNLYRKLKLSKRAKKLVLYFYYDNFTNQFNFGGDWFSSENQYFSIDVLKRNVLPNTSIPRDIIHTLYAPQEGPTTVRAASPQVKDWTKASWKVPKRYRGKKVQLREIVSVFDAPIQTGIDDVKIKKKRKKKG